LSKYLAFGLFVILPFLGGYVGYTFAPVKIMEVERIDSNGTPPDSSSWGLSEIEEVESELVNLSRAEYLRQEYGKRTGESYTISTTSIRVLNSDTKELISLDNLVIEEKLIELTELPYLDTIATSTSVIILSKSCFSDKACGLSGLYEYDIKTKALTQMNVSDFFDTYFRASVISPDKTKIISSDLYYQAGQPNSIYLVDLKSDSYSVLDTVDPSKDEGMFCTGGVGGCADVVVEWLSENKIEVQIFKEGGKNEIRIYSLE